jgi:hypothetical protein
MTASLCRNRAIGALLILAITLLVGCSQDKNPHLRKQVRSLRSQVELQIQDNQQLHEKLATLKHAYQTAQRKAQRDHDEHAKTVKALEQAKLDLEKALNAAQTERDLLDNNLKKLQQQLAAKTTGPDTAEYALIHYYRPDGDYAHWGVHATGPAPANPTEWAKPRRFKEHDGFGGIAKIKLHADHQKYPLEVMIHNGLGDRDCVDETLGDSPNGRHASKVDVSQNKEIWLISGNGKIYRSLEEAQIAVAALKQAATP